MRNLNESKAAEEPEITGAEYYTRGVDEGSTTVNAVQGITITETEKEQYNSNLTNDLLTIKQII